MSVTWNDTGGTVAERTNTVINGLLDWAEKSGYDKITRSNIEDAVIHLTPVESEGTIDQYVEHVTRHGPFYGTGMGKWIIAWDEVE